MNIMTENLRVTRFEAKENQKYPSYICSIGGVKKEILQPNKSKGIEKGEYEESKIYENVRFKLTKKAIGDNDISKYFKYNESHTCSVCYVQICHGFLTFVERDGKKYFEYVVMGIKFKPLEEV